MITKEVYSVDEIGALLSICRGSAYRLVNEQLESDNPIFPVIKYGRSLRIPKGAFDRWVLQRCV